MRSLLFLSLLETVVSATLRGGILTSVYNREKDGFQDGVSHQPLLQETAGWYSLSTHASNSILSDPNPPAAASASATATASAYASTPSPTPTAEPSSTSSPSPPPSCKTL